MIEIYWSDMLVCHFRKIVFNTKLYLMELETNHNVSVLNDSSPKNNSRLGLHSGLMQYSTSGAVSSSNLLLTIPRKKSGLLDDVRSTGWLDAMKSSSPTRVEVTKDSGTELTDSDIAYRNWMVI